METTERIVEAYVRYVKKWATIPNIKCDGQKEIDLFAIDPRTGKKYHIESTVSISQNYRALTNNAYNQNDHKVRGRAARARRTLGFFIKEKFDAKGVKEALKSYGGTSDCEQIIVVWEWKSGVDEEAKANGIALWDFRDMIRKIAELGENKRTYFGDDTLRTLMLFRKALDAEKQKV